MVSRLDIDNASSSDYSGQSEFSIASESIDGVSNNGETYWDYPDWEQNWGYFNAVGDLKSALLMKTIWTVGKGWTANTRDTVRLDRIMGTGKDTFDDIIFNLDLVKNIGGDSFAEIIRNDDGSVVNIRPLDPAYMRSVWDKNGMLVRYEQRSRVKGKKNKTFELKDILHLSNNRLADQIHGISDIKAVEKVIKADAESFEDMQKLVHFQVKPFMIFKMKTDDTTRIKAFATKINEARKNGEDLFVPDDDDLLSWEVVQVNPSSILMEWRNDLKNKYYRQLGMPEILFGTSGATESGGKMEIFAHETTFEHNQRYIERQIWNQLAVRINLIPPSSLLNDLQADEGKDAQNQIATVQKNDVTAGSGK